MKTSDWLMIGALGIGAYFLLKMFSGSTQATNGGSGGWIPFDATPQVLVGNGFPTIDPNKPLAVQNLPPYVAPVTPVQAVAQAQKAGATVYVRPVGSIQQTVAVKQTPTRAALLTVGTPEKQIQQFNVAPRLIKVGGVTRKVM